jgi:hypothetical protein
MTLSPFECLEDGILRQRLSIIEHRMGWQQRCNALCAWDCRESHQFDLAIIVHPRSGRSKNGQEDFRVLPFHRLQDYKTPYVFRSLHFTPQNHPHRVSWSAAALHDHHRRLHENMGAEPTLVSLFAMWDLGSQYAVRTSLGMHTRS